VVGWPWGFLKDEKTNQPTKPLNPCISPPVEGRAPIRVVMDMPSMGEKLGMLNTDVPRWFSVLVVIHHRKS